MRVYQGIHRLQGTILNVSLKVFLIAFCGAQVEEEEGAKGIEQSRFGDFISSHPPMARVAAGGPEKSRVWSSKWIHTQFEAILNQILARFCVWFWTFFWIKKLRTNWLLFERCFMGHIWRVSWVINRRKLTWNKEF